MIKGLGIDIIEVERIKKNILKNDNFKKRIYSEEEINYCEKFKDPYPHYAARFAVKEAFFKATGFNYPFKEVIVKNRDDGAPYIVLKKDIKGSLIVSITHIRELAVAVVVYDN
jgi:holo-[acyl-carrier protein] synthase